MGYDERMRVVAVQFKPTGREGSGAVARVAQLLDGVDPCDLIVLPEMFATGYCFDGRDEIAPYAEPADGPTFAALSEQAKRRRAWVVAGFAERAGEALFNAAWVIRPDGSLADVYRKTLLFDADQSWATPGRGAYTVYDTGVGRFAVGICMDLNDERFIAWNLVARPDVIAFPTNWLDEGVDVHRYWQDRIAPTGATLVAANTWGPERDLAFRGRSAILSRRRVYASTGATGDVAIRADLWLKGATRAV